MSDEHSMRCQREILTFVQMTVLLQHQVSLRASVVQVSLRDSVVALLYFSRTADIQGRAGMNVRSKRPVLLWHMHLHELMVSACQRIW